MTVLVVGGGPAGATAAIQARELGADVTLLEAEQVRDTNLNHAPAPVRTLVRACCACLSGSRGSDRAARRP